jgi:hypothetical protein
MHQASQQSTPMEAPRRVSPSNRLVLLRCSLINPLYFYFIAGKDAAGKTATADARISLHTLIIPDGNERDHLSARRGPQTKRAAEKSFLESQYSISLLRCPFLNNGLGFGFEQPLKRDECRDPKYCKDESPSEGSGGLYAQMPANDCGCGCECSKAHQCETYFKEPPDSHDLSEEEGSHQVLDVSVRSR